ncbi:MAG: T9SS type A sorting domain-containing protein [Ignavibacteria bacterium]|nr:T9SS type A sorting domain-containing protein [Ignavibacteria bacterium]
MKKFLPILLVLLLAGFCYSQWTAVGTVSSVGSYPSLSVASPNIVFVAGGPSGVPYIWRSTNAGVTFTQLPTSGVSLEVYCVWGVDANTIFVGDGGAAGGAGGNAKFYKTTNGGTNWTIVLQTGGTAGFINGIVFSRTNPNFGVVESDPPTGTTYWIAKTHDGGNNWYVTNPPLSGAASAQNSIIVVDSFFYGFGLNAAPTRVGLTTNAGLNWTYQTLVGAVSSSGFISGFAFSTDKLNGIAAGSTTSNTISRTTNAGTTWVSQSIPSSVTSGYCTMKWVPNQPICYVIVSSTSATQCFKSINNGVTWTSMTFPAATGVNHFDIYYDNVTGFVTGYACSGTGQVYKLSEQITGIIDPNNEIPSDFILMQNYPNPFNPTTTIEYSTPKTAYVTVKVYNILGEEVTTLVAEQKQAGNHAVTFDASNYSTGIYYYTLTADNFRETKKMILTK